MNLSLNKLYKKLITATTALALFTGVAHSADAATKVKKAPASMIDARYNDPINQTADLSMAQGYQVGKSTWYGGQVTSAPTLNVSGSFTTIAREDDATVYAKANNPMNVNFVNIRQNSSTIKMPVKINTFTQYALNTALIDNTKLNNEFIALLNKERMSKGLKALSYAEKLQNGTDIRAKELAHYGNITINGVGHQRPDGTMFNTAFRNVKTSAIGENLTVFSYDGNPYKVVSEKFLAEKLFTQWMNSPKHYTNLMSSQFNYSSISVYVGEVMPGVSNTNGIYGVQTLCR